MILACIESEIDLLRTGYSVKIETMRQEGTKVSDRIREQTAARTKSALAEIAERFTSAAEALEGEVAETRRSATLEAGKDKALTLFAELLGSKRYQTFLKLQIEAILKNLPGRPNQNPSSEVEFICLPEDLSILSPIVTKAGFRAKVRDVGEVPVSLDLGGFFVRHEGRILDCSVRGRYERCIAAHGPALGEIAAGEKDAGGR